jgi:hypothetical protein
VGSDCLTPMSQFHFEPATSLKLMRAAVPCHEELQDETARATAGLTARSILELGVGTGARL